VLLTECVEFSGQAVETSLEIVGQSSEANDVAEVLR
jgi:hypothetical protein